MKLGEYQKLKVIKKVEFGIYLAEHEGDENACASAAEAGAGGRKARG